MISEKTAQNSSVNMVMAKVYGMKIHLILSFVVITAVAAHIVIPASPVPFTLQTLAVLLSGAMLGGRNGFYAQLSYIALGALGLPVFASVADGTTGFMSLFGPTGGYLLAFPLGAYVTGKLTEKSSSAFITFAAFIAGEVVIIASGVLYLNTFYIHNISRSFLLGASVFSIWTLSKIVAGTGISALYRRLKK